MRIARVSLIVGQLAVFMLAGMNVASAANVRVTGTITETFPGTCGEPAWTGAVVKIQCFGLEETWAGGISGTGIFDEARSLNVVSGEVLWGTKTRIGPVTRDFVEWVS